MMLKDEKQVFDFLWMPVFSLGGNKRPEVYFSAKREMRYASLGYLLLQQEC